MNGSVIAKRYAEALFAVANKHEILDKVEQDLRLIVNVIKDTEGLVNFLRHPQIDGEVKKQVVDSSFGETISWVSKNFLFQIIDSAREEYIEQILAHYIKLANEIRGIVDITAITADSLTKADQEKISASFSKKLGKEIRLDNVLDPSIIGGMIIQVGDRVYDGSLKNKLQDMKRSLVASRV